MAKTYNLTFSQPGSRVLITRNGTQITSVNSPTTTYADTGAADTGFPVYGARAVESGKVISKPTFVTATRYKIVCDGNSLTAGASAPGSEYPTQLKALITHSNPVSVGVAGNTTAQRVSANATAAQFETGAIAVLWEVTNDLYYGASAATAITNLEAWCAQVQSQGYPVVVATVTPRSDSSTPGTFEADRQTVNTHIRANWATFADAIADVAADARIGAPGAQLDTTYFTDLVHMTAAGYAIVADIVEDAITPLLA